MMMSSVGLYVWALTLSRVSTDKSRLVVGENYHANQGLSAWVIVMFRRSRKLANRLDRNFLLFGLEMRANGQAQFRLGNFFGDGKVAGLPTRVRIGSGQVRRNRDNESACRCQLARECSL